MELPVDNGIVLGDLPGKPGVSSKKIQDKIDKLSNCTRFDDFYNMYVVEEDGHMFSFRKNLKRHAVCASLKVVPAKSTLKVVSTSGSLKVVSKAKASAVTPGDERKRPASSTKPKCEPKRGRMTAATVESNRTKSAEESSKKESSKEESSKEESSSDVFRNVSVSLWRRLNTLSTH